MKFVCHIESILKQLTFLPSAEKIEPPPHQNLFRHLKKNPTCDKPVLTPKQNKTQNKLTFN